jgi:hypothetical protein
MSLPHRIALSTAAASSDFPFFLGTSMYAVLNCLYPFGFRIPKISLMICSCQSRGTNMQKDIRQLGNSAAHADDVKFHQYDVERVIEYVAVIIQYLYSLPKRLKETKEKIMEKKRIK